MLDHRRLSYFLAVAAERSFTRAAERLHIAQPALSRQVRLLEDELGGPLLVRGGAGGLTTTPAGALLLERAPALLRELERMWEDAGRLSGADRGARLLRLGYAASAAHGSAPPILAELRRRDAGIEIRATMTSTPDALERLRAGTLDAAILRTPSAVDGLSLTLIRREAQGVILRAGHPLAVGRGAVPLEALADQTIVIHPRAANPGRYDRILAACHAAGFEPVVEEPLLAFDPTHTLVAGSDRVTIVSDPGAGVPQGLVWVPIHPALLLDVVLVTPVAASADPGAMAELTEAIEVVATREGWLDDPVVPEPRPEAEAQEPEAA